MSLHLDKSFAHERKTNEIGLKIRGFSLGDLKGVLELRRASLVEEFELFGSDERSFKKQMIIYMLLRFIERLTGKFFMRVYVCEVGRNIVGVTLLTKSGECWLISGVMVGPKHRRKSYGRRLVSKACEDAANFGAHRVYLDVLENNKAARSLYESLNFKKSQRRLYFCANWSNLWERNLPQGFRVVELSTSLFSKVLRKMLKLGTTEKFAILHDEKSIGVLELLFGYRKEMANISLTLCDKYLGKGIEEALLAKALERAHIFRTYKVMLNIDERYTKLKEACDEFGFKFLCATHGMFKNLKHGRT